MQRACEIYNKIELLNLHCCQCWLLRLFAVLSGCIFFWLTVVCQCWLLRLFAVLSGCILFWLTVVCQCCCLLCCQAAYSSDLPLYVNAVVEVVCCVSGYILFWLTVVCQCCCWGCLLCWQAAYCSEFPSARTSSLWQSWLLSHTQDHCQPIIYSTFSLLQQRRSDNLKSLIFKIKCM